MASKTSLAPIETISSAMSSSIHGRLLIAGFGQFLREMLARSSSRTSNEGKLLLP
jgi:hypothetical protein